MGDLRAELLAAFEAELSDHLAAIRAALGEADAGRPVDLRELSRLAHSLKGAARAVEQPATEALAHQAETLLLAIGAGERRLDAPTIAELRTLTDGIQDRAAEAAVPAAEASPSAAVPDERVRVGGRHVERIARTLHDLANQVQQNKLITEAMEDLEVELAAIAAVARRDGASEVARRLSRALVDLQRTRREQARQRSGLERTTTMLEHDAEAILLLPLDTLFDGYERMVREIAASQGKVALLRVEPFQGEADRRVLQALREPVLHMLRNAVSHGIESPPERRRAGKPEQGTVTIRADLEGGRLNLVIADDGRGLDYRRIEARARASGLLAPGTPTPARDVLRELLFEQGFSTAEQVDEVSGRGIGLAVVMEAVRRLHGRLEIGASALGGAEIRLSLPSALTRQTLLIVEAGGESVAIPAAAVDQLLRVRPSAIQRSEGAELLSIAGNPVPIVALADLTGAGGAADEASHHHVLVLESGEDRVALAVDALSDVRSLIVGDPVAIAAEVPLVYGTAIVEDGVSLVLNPEALMAEARRRRGGTTLARSETAGQAERRTILVVDDSITTRTLEKAILEAQGYHVLISVDGLAALERLRSGMDRIDLVVADVEMPRMDGFALLTAIRNDPALGAIPVVMMTSRNSPDDIDRGLDLGANAYVTKQEFDQGRLISVVQQLI